MGNALRKAKGGPVDGGQLRTSTPQVIEYDVNAVAKMIQSRRLAPFYEGLPDAQTADNTSYDSLDSTNDSLGLTGDTSLGSTRNSSPRLTKKKKSLFRKTRQKNDSNYEQQCLSHFLRNRSIECPICFLCFPRNMNKTSCCQQVLCTKCFVNLRRPPSGRTISCPFCNRRDFSVEYRSPMQLLEEDAGVTSHNRPSPVKCEQIRVHRPPPSAPPSAAYRAATTRYYGYNGPPFTVRSGSRAATYGGGVLILYNERGEPIYVPEPPRSTRTAPYGAPLPSNRNNPYRSQYRTSYRDPYGYLANSYRYAY